MDETDLRICGLLNTNSRIPFRDLAERLGISVQAAHKRVKVLTDTGVLRHFTANISLKALNAVPAAISGHTKAASADEVAIGLGKNEFSAIVHVSGDFLSVMILLRSIGDLDNYVEFVKKEAQMEDISIFLPSTMGFTNLERQNLPKEDLVLTRLDYRIILSLHKDSRKELVDIAKELGLSTRTVKRRLKRMTDAGVIEFTTEFDYGAQNGISSLMIIDLKPGLDRGRFLGEVKNRLGPRTIFMGAYSNIPNGLFAFMWSASMKECRETEASLRGDPAIAAFKNLLIQNKHQFPTWRERLLEERAAEMPRRK
ncbi:MAG TPA: winged helix-turn-helix transcriptional regulator [Thermoplasmata archaeon]|jgi:DNA-binding Lrp family transcriptional regulator